MALTTLTTIDKSHLNELIEKENATRRLVQPPQSDYIKRSTSLPTPPKARQTRQCMINQHRTQSTQCPVHRMPIKRTSTQSYCYC